MQLQTKAHILHLRYRNFTGNQSISDAEHEYIEQWKKCMIKQVVTLSELFDKKGKRKIEEEANSH